MTQRKEVIIFMKSIRIIGRNIRAGVKNVVRNLSLSFASIACISVTLLLVALSLVGSLNVEHFTENIRDDFTIVTYIKLDADTVLESDLKRSIESLDNIESVTFDSKYDVANRMKQESDIFNDFISSWADSENPLYDTYLVKVKESERISETAKEIEAIEGVQMVKYGQGMIESLMSIFNIIKKILIVIVVSLVVVTAFLIINTIKITIFSRHREIEIKRLVGTSNTSIKQPFVIEGLILGLLGSIIPVIATIWGYTILYEKSNGIVFSQFIRLIDPNPFVFKISGVLVIIGVVVGMLGSAGAVRKYLKI